MGWSISRLWNTDKTSDTNKQNILCCHGLVILWCVAQIFIFGVVGSISNV